MAEDIKILEKGILEKLPQIPFVVDQVGYAMEWAKEEHDEGAYYKTIKIALDVAEYTAKTSTPKFFKTHLVIAALLMDIEGATENPKFDMFKSASQATEKALAGVTISPSSGEKYGCFKAVTLHLVKLAKENQDYLCVVLLGILAELNDILAGMKEADVKTPITPEDYIKVLGYALNMQNLLTSRLDLYNTTREITNKISIALNSINF